MAMEVGVKAGGRSPSFREVRLFQEIGRRLDSRGFIASNDGNLSLRADDGSILITATGARKGYLQPGEIVRIDVAGQLLCGERPASSEAAMHLAVYCARPDVRAIVHAHPPVATGFSVAREPMDACVLPEIILTLGKVPIAPYGTPGTGELGASLGPYLRDHAVILLANHGAIALAADLEEAYFRMERLEHTAKILLAARLLGRIQGLGREDVERLLATAGPLGTGSLPCVPAAPDALSCAPGVAATLPGTPAASRPLPLDSAALEDGLAAREANGYPGPLGPEYGEPGVQPSGAAAPADVYGSARLVEVILDVLVRRGLIARGKE